MVAHAIFLRIGVVGMRGAEHLAHVVVIAGVLVLVAHNEADRAACRLTLEDTAEQFHVVCLIACRRNVALTRAPTV